MPRWGCGSHQATLFLAFSMKFLKDRMTLCPDIGNETKVRRQGEELFVMAEYKTSHGIHEIILIDF